MKKVLTIITMVAVLAAFPTYANSKRAAFTDDAQGIKERIEALKTERAELQEEKKAEVLEAVKKVAVQKIDNLIRKYETIKNRVNKMTVIADAQKTELVAKIDAKINSLNDLKNEVENSTDFATVKNIMDKVKAEVKNSVATVKEVVAAIHLSHYTNLLTRLNKVFDTLTEKVADLKADGKNVTTAEAKLAEVKTKLDGAKTAIDAKNWTEARKLLGEARLGMVKLNKVIKDVTKGAETSDSEE